MVVRTDEWKAALMAVMMVVMMVKYEDRQMAWPMVGSMVLPTVRKKVE